MEVLSVLNNEWIGYVRVLLLLEVLVHGRGLRHLDGGHGVDVEREDLGAAEADDEALQLLLVHGEAARLDAQQPAAAEAQHLLALVVPRHAVRVRLLSKHTATHMSADSKHDT